MDHGDSRTTSGSDAEIDLELLVDSLAHTSFAVDLFSKYEKDDKSEAMKKMGRDKVQSTKAKSKRLRERLEALERQLDHP